MSNWEDYVVSYIDLIDIGNIIKSGNSEATNLMQQFHTLTYKSINTDMPFHHYAYAWNDSAMFLAFPKDKGDYETIMRELNKVKPRFDGIRPSYVICVKGKAIPEPVCAYGVKKHGQSKFVFLKSSGYAFKNCFTVEEKLKKHKMDWYIDSWITRKIKNFPKAKPYKVTMLPTKRKRDIYVLKGQIW
ncbi:hypothetical protein OAC89_04055 [Deltaproteobacteria bacterium]|nr:hypothetical protein [Deltaproteobacteria bacterium]